MLEKSKKHIARIPFHQLRDVRVVGLIFFGVIALLVTWSTLGAIQANYELQKQIARLEEQNKVHELENANLALKNQYFETDQYLELTARRQYGKALPGEKVLLVPESVALAKTIDIKEDRPQGEKKSPQKPRYQKNFEAWMRFLFRPEGDS